MKKMLSIIIIAVMLLSSTLSFASNGKEDKKNNNFISNFQNQIKELEKQFKNYHGSDSTRNNFITALTDLRNKLSIYDRNYKTSSMTVYINGTVFKSNSSDLITYNNINIPGDLISKGLGADFRYNRSSRTMTISKASEKLVINLKSNKITENGSEIKPNVLTTTRTNVSIQLIKFISEKLGFKASVNEKQGILVIDGTGVLQNADLIAPTVPLSLSAVTQSPTQININWVASSDNVSVTGYKVFRNGAQVATLKAVTS